MKPKFLILISSANYSCSGKQLLEIINVLLPFIKYFLWYGSDVEISGELPFKYNLESWNPKKIGNTQDLIKLVQNVDQFLS